MMQKQTLEFNIGYIFSRIENSIFKHTKEHCDEFFGTIQVPKIWFGINQWGDTDLTLSNKMELYNRLHKVCDDMFIHWDNSFYIGSKDQYIMITCHFSKKEQPKKMTVKEIEKALGYKVEIVSGD